ncbi:hypothetical protein FQR65_LT20768 [Abscondita terminalis]|nr:hypothetical protein FQR65_LT20768 [Abscondita terminalis]
MRPAFAGATRPGAPRGRRAPRVPAQLEHDWKHTITSTSSSPPMAPKLSNDALHPQPAAWPRSRRENVDHPDRGRAVPCVRMGAASWPPTIERTTRTRSAPRPEKTCWSDAAGPRRLPNSALSSRDPAHHPLRSLPGHHRHRRQARLRPDRHGPRTAAAAWPPWCWGSQTQKVLTHSTFDRVLPTRSNGQASMVQGGGAGVVTRREDRSPRWPNAFICIRRCLKQCKNVGAAFRCRWRPEPFTDPPLLSQNPQVNQWPGVVRRRPCLLTRRPQSACWATARGVQTLESLKTWFLGFDLKTAIDRCAAGPAVLDEFWIWPLVTSPVGAAAMHPPSTTFSMAMRRWLLLVHGVVPQCIVHRRLAWHAGTALTEHPKLAVFRFNRTASSISAFATLPRRPARQVVDGSSLA